ncbi:MAG: MFS transporter, partial [Dermabacter sp.]|nr:MFS transporter [Dermabacter sp.]
MSTMTKRRRWSLLVTVGAGLLLITLDNSILYTALPTLTEDLQASSTQSLWIINAYPLVLAGLLLGTGTLGDKIGHRRMFEVGLVIFGLASTAAAFAPNVAILIAARGFLGAGAAVLMPSTLALIRQTFLEPRERNTAIGIWGSVATVGSAVGPLLGGFLLTHTWWGAVFLINIPIVIIALVSTYLLAPDNYPNPKRSWDFMSSLYAMITMVGLVLTIENLAHTPIDTTLVATGIVLFIIGMLLFIHRQRYLDVPLLTLDVFRSRLFTAGFLGAFLGMFVVSGMEILT